MIRFLFFPDHGAASPTYGRGAQPRKSGRAAAQTLDDERYCGPGFLPEFPLRVSHRAGAFPERESHAGASPGMETDEEMALSPVEERVVGCSRFIGL